MLLRIAAAALAALLGGAATYAATADAGSAKALRATRAEVAEFCKDADALPIGGATAAGVAAGETGSYGCVGPRGWIRCDGHGNCAGGNGAATRIGAGRSTRED